MTAMSAPEKLCTELYENIIEFLQDDEAALRACSLVSRSWVPASRSHLFRDITLTGSRAKGDSWAADTQCRRLYVNVLSSPHLARYVESLTVQESSANKPSNYRWVCAEITFPPLLKKLSSLSVLEFDFPIPSRASSKVSWSTLVFNEITEAVSNLPLESFTLRQFSFHTLAQFIKVLNSFRHLKTLQLDCVDILADTQWSNTALDHVFQIPFNPGSILEAKNSAVERLMLRSDCASLFIPILLHPRSPIDLSELKYLTGNISVGDYGHFYDLLLFAPKLESLEIEIDPLFNYDTYLENKAVINLSRLPFLKVLNLSVSLLLGRNDPVPWILAFLSTVQDSNTLEELFLTVTLDKPPPSLTLQDFDDTLALWQGLDELLSRPTYDKLHRIRLDFVLDNPIGDDSLKQISDELVKQLQALGRKGKLEFDVCELR